MPVLRILLQVVLCFAVLLNGVGIAGAATTMEMAQVHAAQPVSSPLAAPFAHAVCPDDAPGERAADHGPALDCSTSTVCDFACGLHFLLPAVAPAMIAALLPAGSAAMVTGDHAPPVLVLPTRPPIR